MPLCHSLLSAPPPAAATSSNLHCYIAICAAIAICNNMHCCSNMHFYINMHWMLRHGRMRPQLQCRHCASAQICCFCRLLLLEKKLTVIHIFTSAFIIEISFPTFIIAIQSRLRCWGPFDILSSFVSSSNKATLQLSQWNFQPTWYSMDI